MILLKRYVDNVYLAVVGICPTHYAVQMIMFFTRCLLDAVYQIQMNGV